MRKEQRTGSGGKGNSGGGPRGKLQKEKSRGELRIAGTYAGAGLLKILTADDADGLDEGFLIRVILKSVGTSRTDQPNGSQPTATHASSMNAHFSQRWQNGSMRPCAILPPEACVVGTSPA